MSTFVSQVSGPLATMLAVMECVAIEVVGEDLRVLSAEPEWLLSLEDGRAHDVLETLPFLEAFLIEAQQFWDAGDTGRLQSDFWTQTTPGGEDVNLLATAATVEGRRLIVVRSANDLHRERQQWQLYAHQTAMQLQVIERLKGELEKSASALKTANEQLSELSIRDGLTGLYNRRYFDQSFELELNRSMRTGEPLSVLFMDVDKFKVLNDTYGHATGDECLKAVSGVLQETVRRPNDTVARFGGEEFAVLLPATDAENAFAIATAINKDVRALGFENKNSDVEPYVTVSVGVYTRQPDGYRTMGQILEAVDGALYRAKQEGRNRVLAANRPERFNSSTSRI